MKKKNSSFPRWTFQLAVLCGVLLVINYTDFLSAQLTAAEKPLPAGTIILDDNAAGLTTNAGDALKSLPSPLSFGQTIGIYRPVTGASVPMFQATWDLGTLRPDTYDVYVTWTWGASMPKGVEYSVQEASATLMRMVVNHQKRPNGPTWEGCKFPWQKIGAIVAKGDAPASLSLSAPGNTTLFLDALALVPRNPAGNIGGSTQSSSEKTTVIAKESYCGNGFVSEGEECDDGNLKPGDGCSDRCMKETCGDGVVSDGEECDTQDDIRCDASRCRWKYCGDRIVQSELGEECDDGNRSHTDACPNTCRKNTTPSCATEGETIGTYPTRDATSVQQSCCEGLSRINIAFEAETGVCAVQTDGVICAFCGNGTCGLGENSCNCSKDCPASAKCTTDADCPPIRCLVAPCPENTCVNGTCTPAPADCAQNGATVYTDSKLGPTRCCNEQTDIRPNVIVLRDACIAPTDGSRGVCIDGWQRTCGNGQCGEGENACTCPQDCSSSSSSPASSVSSVAIRCIGEGESGPVIPTAPPCCDGLTRVNISIESADGQCAMMTGAFRCTKCGDGQCGTGENRCNCQRDCAGGGPVCGNGQCEGDLEKVTCPRDCGSSPSSSSSSAVSSMFSCAQDGQRIFADAAFGPTQCCNRNAGIKPTTALVGKQCITSNDLSVGTCVNAWWMTCGNRTCNAGEDQCNCPVDCAPASSSSSSFLCPMPAAPFCPNGTLIGMGRDANGCIKPPVCCGNQRCETGENSLNCAKDCPPSSIKADSSASSAPTFLRSLQNFFGF